MAGCGIGLYGYTYLITTPNLPHKDPKQLLTSLHNSAFSVSAANGVLVRDVWYT